MEFSETLLAWYDEHKRNLPWRNTTDPYLIWISEIILQQTRVVQGFDYFKRFVERFPNVKALAEAHEDEVMKYWQGLGYYSRARNLHFAAKSIRGEFPSTYNDIIALKGVGEYTAAAIASFAFSLPYAVVDGNVYRVLSRYFDIDAPIDSTKGKKLFKELANDLLDKNHPADYNQAIMDFGALQCTPKSPNCEVCPFSEKCLSLANLTVDVRPLKEKKIKVTNRYLNYFFVRKGEATFLRKRTSKDIWQNLYELPLIETSAELSEKELYQSEEFQNLFGGYTEISISNIKKGVKHVLSHRHLYTNFYEIIIPEKGEDLPNYLKINSNEIHQFAVPKLIHSFLSELL